MRSRQWLMGFAALAIVSIISMLLYQKMTEAKRFAKAAAVPLKSTRALKNGAPLKPVAPAVQALIALQTLQNEQREAQAAAETSAQEEAQAPSASHAGSTGGEYRSWVIPKEQQLALETWGCWAQALALTAILDNENYNRDPYLVGCAYGIGQKIDGWGSEYVEGDVDSQLRWVCDYISSRYGDAVNAWAYRQANGAY